MTSLHSPVMPNPEIPAAPASFGPAARFALYYAPPVTSPWWPAGCAWLQRDPSSSVVLSPPDVPGLSRPLAELTSEPRRYGWHATLVAPFTCRPGIDGPAVLQLAADWAARQQGFTLPARVALLERFVALQAAIRHTSGAAEEAALRALAADAVRTFAPLRAAPGAAEVAKRRKMQLSARQEALMLEWGYPFVFDEFRFHLTLSNSVAAADAQIMLDWWARQMEVLGPLPIDGAAIYVQPQPGADFLLWQRLPFGATGAACGIDLTRTSAL